jgi:hypothetical protein
MATDNIPAGDTEPDQVTNTDQRNHSNISTKDPDVKEHKVDIEIDDLDAGRIPDTQGSNLPKLTQVIITNVPRRLKHNSKTPTNGFSK